jgi:hypothetical protein
MGLMELKAVVMSLQKNKELEQFANIAHDLKTPPVINH